MSPSNYPLVRRIVDGDSHLPQACPATGWSHGYVRDRPGCRVRAGTHMRQAEIDLEDRLQNSLDRALHHAILADRRDCEEGSELPGLPRFGIHFLRAGDGRCSPARSSLREIMKGNCRRQFRQPMFSTVAPSIPRSALAAITRQLSSRPHPGPRGSGRPIPQVVVWFFGVFPTPTGQSFSLNAEEPSLSGLNLPKTHW